MPQAETALMEEDLLYGRTQHRSSGHVAFAGIWLTAYQAKCPHRKAVQNLIPYAENVPYKERLIDPVPPMDKILIYRDNQEYGLFTTEGLRGQLVAGNVIESAKIRRSTMTQAASKSSCSKVGCIGLCVVVGLTLLLAQIFGPSIKIEGTTGTLSHTLNPLSTAHLEADNICWDVFDAAKRHPELTTINVDCDMESLFDRYGHPITPHEGTITVSDLDEVRRYTDSTAYAMDKAQEIEIQISSMPDANQLKQ